MDISEFVLARVAEDESDANSYAAAIWSSTDSDQRRLLAECDAKRRMVELFQGLRAGESVDAGRKLADSVLELLAVPYADHPDYREEWRPV
jgi:hypothetical protein